MKKHVLIISLCLLLFPILTFASEADETFPVWEIEQRCLPPITLPPDGWRYSGTLLMSGYGGIHAIQHDWETPRIMARDYQDEYGVQLEGGQLSPDGRWFAVPIGERFREISYNVYWFTKAVRVHSTVDDTVIVIQKKYSEGESNWAWMHQVVRWINPEEFRLGYSMYHPFGEPIEESYLNYPLTIVTDFEREWVINPSPDWTRMYHGKFGDNVLSNRIESSEIPFYVKQLAWRHDSAGFAAIQDKQLLLYDRDGNITANPYTVNTDQMYYTFTFNRSARTSNTVNWSPDDRYFTFKTPDGWMILDTHEQTIINTCNHGSLPVWSPDGAYLAFLQDSPDPTLSRVTILDFENWRQYDVARHVNRGPVMLFWRE